MKNPVVPLAICAVALALAPAAQASGKRVHKAFDEFAIIHPMPGYPLVRCHYGHGHPPLYPPVKYCSA
jgi:hypothetical protein